MYIMLIFIITTHTTTSEEIFIQVMNSIWWLALYSEILVTYFNALYNKNLLIVINLKDLYKYIINLIPFIMVRLKLLRVWSLQKCALLVYIQSLMTHLLRSKSFILYNNDYYFSFLFLYYFYYFTLYNVYCWIPNISHLLSSCSLFTLTSIKMHHV